MSQALGAGSALVLTGPGRVDGRHVNILHISCKFCTTNCPWHAELCWATWMAQLDKTCHIHSACKPDTKSEGKKSGNYTSYL